MLELKWVPTCKMIFHCVDVGSYNTCILKQCLKRLNMCSGLVTNSENLCHLLQWSKDFIYVKSVGHNPKVSSHHICNSHLKHFCAEYVGMFIRSACVPYFRCLAQVVHYIRHVLYYANTPCFRSFITIILVL